MTLKLGFVFIACAILEINMGPKNVHNGELSLKSDFISALVSNFMKVQNVCVSS